GAKPVPAEAPPVQAQIAADKPAGGAGETSRPLRHLGGPIRYSGAGGAALRNGPVGKVAGQDEIGRSRAGLGEGDAVDARDAQHAQVSEGRVKRQLGLVDALVVTLPGGPVEPREALV